MSVRTLVAVDWTRDALTVTGFSGFIPLATLAATEPPKGAGVYVVLREATTDPDYLALSRGGWFKGKDPTVPVAILQGAWVDGAPVLYIGKAPLGKTGKRGLAKRLDEFHRFGAGKRVGHWGGRYIWQLSDSDRLLVAWRETPDEDPGDVESALLD
jgi:hypothetical protein